MLGFSASAQILNAVAQAQQKERLRGNAAQIAPCPSQARNESAPAPNRGLRGGRPRGGRGGASEIASASLLDDADGSAVIVGADV